MDKEIAIQWCAELRSGKYIQGQNKLCKITPDGDEEYCCLGVLCNMLNEPFEIITNPFNDNDNVKLKSYNNEGPDYLPESVLKKTGMKQTQGIVEETPSNGLKERIVLSYLNDSGKTFNEIADIIEQHSEEL